MGINVLRRWNPTLEININTKTAKRPADDRTDGQTGILYCHSGHLNPGPEDACSLHKYGPCKLNFISDLQLFSKPKSRYSLFIKFFILQWFIKKIIKQIIALVNLNSMGHANDRQKGTWTNRRIDRDTER